MLPKKKTNTMVAKINDSVEQLATVTPTDSNNGKIYLLMFFKCPVKY